MNDGGSADYYKLPKGATDLQDIIEHKNMNFATGNMFKAIYRVNDTTHSEPVRDLRKIIWFAEREIKRLNVDESEVTYKVDMTLLKDTYPLPRFYFKPLTTIQEA